MATCEPRGLIHIRRNESRKVEITVLQVDITKDLNPEHRVSQKCDSVTQRPIAICGINLLATDFFQILAHPVFKM